MTSQCGSCGVVVAVALVAGGCGGAGVSSVPAATGTAPALAGTASGVPEASAPGDGGTLDDEVSAMLARVASVRGLPPRAEVRGEVIERSEMLERLQRQLREEVPPAVVAAQSELLFALGTVPSDFEYERSLLELMEDQLAGFYEPDEGTMFLMSDLAGAERAATLAHELVHALQDQHYGLGGRLDYRDDANDEQSALHTLAEGEATSVMLEVVQGRSALESSDAALALMMRGGVAVGSGEGVPGIIKRSIVAPYVDGLIAVHQARRESGWGGVDALWARPPRTTEQLLHREQWAADEPPRAVPIPPPPSGGPSLVAYHDVEGEQSLRTLFEEWMPRYKAAAAASGWGGDRVAVFQDERGSAMAWALRFDDAAGAERAAVAFARGILATAAESGSEEEAVRALAGGEVCRERTEAGPFSVVRRGAAVGLVAGPFRRLGNEVRGLGDCASASAWGRRVAEAVSSVR